MSARAGQDPSMPIALQSAAMPKACSLCDGDDDPVQVGASSASIADLGTWSLHKAKKTAAQPGQARHCRDSLCHVSEHISVSESERPIQDSQRVCTDAYAFIPVHRDRRAASCRLPGFWPLGEMYQFRRCAGHYLIIQLQQGVSDHGCMSLWSGSQTQEE